ncbi:peptidylprolyl isomerase [Pelomonas sp. CA6]|uniref:peptidylprolyl isomerase n=1 Tax=Pelomonas sp. CA6 TaxID=2907999 RepID=UPI001F4B97C9|nr:peptidylprolyl isomerase [Pelomonas sp. CA6]MCH7342757.1 peptidylprolyl isomerase [Pelomonas sp. CA6]
MSAPHLKRQGQALALAGTAALITACGGGGSDAGSPINPQPQPIPPVTMVITHKVLITTSQGQIELGLDAQHAPVTTANFLKYVKDGYYVGTLFHRVEKDFVVQGGGMARDTVGRLVDKATTYPPIALESKTGLSNVAGTIAMARTQVPDSATSQFYINVVDNAAKLNYPNPDGYGYAVFGKLLSGADVVERIRNLPVRNEGLYSNVPTQDVVVTAVTQTQ